MKFLNLTPGFDPFAVIGDVISYDTHQFSGGEPHIKVHEFWNSEGFLDIGLTEPNTESVTITSRINSFNDFGLFAITVDALRRMGVKTINGFIPYFPGARQDRVAVPGEPLTVSVYADLVNALNLDKVFVMDPHSDVTPAVINNCHVITNHLFIKWVLTQLWFSDLGYRQVITLVSPDAGSNKKMTDLHRYLNEKPSKVQVNDMIKCDKSRNVETGELSGFDVYADDLNGRDCLIVDDICDGGGTFLGLGEELKKKNAGRLYLAVTHGIFSKGFHSLNQMFEMIYTTDSIKNWTGSDLEAYNHYSPLPAKLKAWSVQMLSTFTKDYSNSVEHGQDIDF